MTSLPIWLTDFDPSFHRNDVLANLGKKSHREMLLTNSKATRNALKYGLREPLYNLLDQSDIPLQGILRLVAAGATNETSFLTAIFENTEFEDLKQIALDKPFRLRYELHKAGELIEGSPVVDEFLRCFPSPQHVRKARSGKLFPAAHQFGHAATKAIMELHAEGNPLRLSILKRGIREGKLADFLEQNTPVMDDAPVDVSSLVRKAQAASLDGRAVRRFYLDLLATRDRASALKEGGGSSGKIGQERISELKKLREKLAEEEKFVMSRDKEDEKAALRRLQDLKKVVQPHEKWDRPMEDTAASLLDELRVSVEQSLSAVREGDYDTVTQLASLASGSLLRKGMLLLPSRSECSSLGCRDEGNAEGEEPHGEYSQMGKGSFVPAPLSAFGEPQYLRNFSTSPMPPGTGKELRTTSVAAFSHFENSIQTHGLDYAANVYVGGFGGWGVAEVRTSFQKQKREEHTQRDFGRTELKTACLAICEEVPMCSFEPATAAMTFTEDVLRELAGIDCNHIRAMKFMEKYGEVVPVGTHTLGGLILLKMTLEKNSKEDSSLTYDCVDKEWHASLSTGGFFIFGGTAAVAAQNRDQDTRNEGTAHELHSHSRTLDTTLIGPQAINRGTFCDALRSSNKTWRVLGRDLSFRALIPIWEVVEHSSEAESLVDPAQVAHVLRSAWCNRAMRIIEESHPLLLENHKQILVQLYHAETNHPSSGLKSVEEGAENTNWLRSAQKEMQLEIENGLAATGDYANSERRSALVESFRIFRIHAPKSWQTAPELRYIAFQSMDFCNFVETSLSSKSYGVEMVLRARLHIPEIVNGIMRILRGHAGGTDTGAQDRYPHLTGFLFQMASGNQKNGDEFTSVGVLGPDFPDEISLEDTFTWLKKLSDPKENLSDSSRSSAALQVLHAAVAGLERDRRSLVHQEEKERMHTHIDRFNRICRNYHFMRDHFLDGSEPSSSDLHSLAGELRDIILRDFKEGDIVKKSVAAPRWEGSIDGRATMYGRVVDHDKAKTAHVSVHWLLLKGLEDLELSGKQAAQILQEPRSEKEEENSGVEERNEPLLGRLRKAVLRPLFKEREEREPKIFCTFAHVSDIELASELPSPSAQSRSSNGRSGLASGLLLQSEPFFGRLSLCADRSSEASSTAPLHYVDNLRWRLPDVDRNLFHRVVPGTSNEITNTKIKTLRTPKSTLGSKDFSESASPNVPEASCSFRSSGIPEMDVYADLERAEEVDQVRICDALLDQRKAFPLFWKREGADNKAIAPGASGKQPGKRVPLLWKQEGVDLNPATAGASGKQQAKKDLPARDIFPVLAFLSARLEIPKHVVDLCTDERLPRFVFYEPHPYTRTSAASMSNDVLHTHFRRSAAWDMIVSLEMSVGFMEEEQNEEASFAPCIVFFVRGNARILPEYLKHAFNAGVMVVSSCDARSTVEMLPDFFTRPDKAICFSLEPSEDMPENWYGPTVSISHEELKQSLREFVRDVLQMWREEERSWESMRSLFSTLRVSKDFRNVQHSSDRTRVLEAPPVARTKLFECATENHFSNLNFPVQNVRSSMQLQELFREEARIEDGQLARSRLRDIRNRVRPQAATRVLQHPIMKCFIEVLQAPTRTQRLLRLQRLDRFLAEASLQNGTVSHAQRQIDRIDYESDLLTTSEARLNFLKAERRKLVSVQYNNSIDLACLSREMGCLYSALFETNRRAEVEHLPDLAAQLLLDGGMIEFMDGDAAKVNSFWVSSVLRALNLKLKDMHGGKEVLVSVRSVFGVQSCGKSTVLNCMFGCQLRTSAGVCTRGMNMFLVPCERPGSPFQAILGLDTEGICSPEQERQNASETALINNRMALYCVLLADAGLCISTTEANDIFRETLSIVMAVYHGSDMGVRQGGMRTRLFFLYNRSSTVDEVNGDRMKLVQDRVFLEVLRAAWKQASNQLGGTEEDGQLIPPAFLTLLDKDKDIERVQQMNRGPRAPNDVPDPDFGRKLAKFNDHIHDSLTNGNDHFSSVVAGNGTPPCGTTLFEFIERVSDVTEAVHWGKNYLLYPDIVRYKQQVREDASFEASVHEASKLSYDEFIKLQSEMIQENEKGLSEGRNPKGDVSASNALEAPKDWESSSWPTRTRDMVYNVFEAKRDDMQQALRRLMGGSFEDKIQVYDRQWDEKTKVDCEAKLRAMKTKWVVMNGIAPRLEALKKEVYGMLFQEATTAREETNSSEDRNEIARRKFEKVFEFACKTAKQEDPNINVKSHLLSVALHELHPPLAFGKGALQRYMDEIIYASNPKRMPGYIEQWWNLLPAFHYYAYERSDEYVKTISSEAERMAKSASDEYSKHVGYEILSKVDVRIQLWNQNHGKHRFSDSDRTKIHMHTVGRIGDILQGKHDHYYRQHGLAARIAKERTNMLKYFDIMVRGRIGLQALDDMLRGELERCLRDSRHTFAASQARRLLDSEPWLRSTEGSLALVDYEILQEYQTGDKARAVLHASDPNYFKSAIARRIVLSMDTKKLHDDMVHDLTNALHLAQDACVKDVANVSAWRTALGELNTRCSAKHLTIDLSASLNILYDSPPVTEDLENTVARFFECLVDWLKTLPADSSPLDGTELYESMGRDMPTERTLQARCGSGCPRCSMPCMKELGHDVHYSGDLKLHSCTHQPSGLAGGFWHNSECLIWESCVVNTMKDKLMRSDDDNETMPFRKFREWYPEWEQPPTTQRARPVREFLFYNCQDEILQRYPGKKKCQNLDESNFSRHSLAELLQTTETIAFGRHK